MSEETYDWDNAGRATVETVVNRLMREGFHQDDLPGRSKVAETLAAAGRKGTVAEVDAVLAELGKVLAEPFPGLRR